MVTLVFVTLAAGLFWLDYFRGYNAEVIVLVVARSGTTETSGEVAANMAELTQTLSFYNRVLSENDLIDDDFDGYTPDKRKVQWNNTVSVTKQDGSGVLIIRANGDTPEKVRRLALQTAQSMFAIASFYYNVRTDADMRMVDGPIVSYAIRTPWLYGGTVLFSGLAVTMLFFFLLRAVPELIGIKSKLISFSDVFAESEKSNIDEALARRAYPEFGVSDTALWIDPKKFIPEKPHTLPFEGQFPETVVAPRIYGEHAVKHSQAPANLPTAPDETDLPVADETSLPFEFETASEETDMSLAQSREDSSAFFPEAASPALSAEREQSEPTQEAYKRRLNELLANVGK